MTRVKIDVRRTIGFDKATFTRLRDKAKAHRVSQAAFLRALVNGHRAGADPGSLVALADALYDRCSPKRRVSMMRYHYPVAFAAATKADEVAQPTIFDPQETTPSC